MNIEVVVLKEWNSMKDLHLVNGVTTKKWIHNKWRRNAIEIQVEVHMRQSFEKVSTGACIEEIREEIDPCEDKAVKEVKSCEKKWFSPRLKGKHLKMFLKLDGVITFKLCKLKRFYEKVER